METKFHMSVNIEGFIKYHKERPRYLLFEKKDLNSNIMFQSNNKQEVRKLRTSWRRQFLLLEVNPDIYDSKNNCWIT